RTHSSKIDLNDSNFDLQTIKKCLENSPSAIKKFDQLQALVLKLSNQEPTERRATVQAIVDIDLFNLKGGTATTLKDLLWPVNTRTPHPLQTSAAKLLNVIVSHRIGRNYFNKLSIIKLLTWNATEAITDSMASNLLAAMRKLSLDRYQLVDMLKNGLIQWLINHMERFAFTATAFHMECASDLLRILMDIETATECSYVNVCHVIVVLVRCLNIQNEYVKVNLCHCLRVFLRNDIAIEIGNTINLLQIVEGHMKRLRKTANTKMKADLQFIRKLFLKYRKSLPNKVLTSSVDFSNQIRTMQFCRKNPNRTQTHIRQEFAEKKIMKKEGNDNGKLVASSSKDGTRFNENATRILFSNSNAVLDQRSSFLSSASKFMECKIKTIKTLDTTRSSNGSNREELVEMDESTSKLQTGEVNELSTHFSDLTSIAKDPNARNEILENESFINELCEKVFAKVGAMLQKENCCGPNCNMSFKPNREGEDDEKM
ncbi:hypothetical protein Bhyg_10039, partial [Pseudolycoriella hygida]